MGLFDIFKGNSGNNGSGSADNVSSFKKDLIQEVALFMYQAKITDMPALKFFNEDQGLFEAKFVSMMNDLSLNRMKYEMHQMYLTVMGAHFLGAAVHIAASQATFHKSVAEFGKKEIKQIALDFSKTDAYELALKDLGISANSNNKKVIDGIIVTAKTAAERLAGDISKKPDYLKAYCEVMYNAGVTLAYR